MCTVAKSDRSIRSLRYLAMLVGIWALVLAGTAMALSVDIELTPDEPYAGDYLKVRVMVGNSGVDPVHDLRLELLYPAQLVSTAFASISDGGTCSGTICSSGNVLTWELGTLAPGATRTVHLPPRVATGAADDTVIDFGVQAFSGMSQLGSASRSVRVRNTPRLAVFIDPVMDPLEPGAAQQYTVSFANQATQAATNGELRVLLPPDTSLLDASDDGVLVGNEVVWDLDILQAGQADRRWFSLQPGASWDAGELLPVDSAEMMGLINQQPFSAVARTVSRLESAPGLSFHLSFGPDPVLPNTRMNGRLTVANRGLDAAQDVIVELPYPQFLAGTAFASISDGGVCSGTSCSTGNLVRWELGDLQPGEGRSVFLPPATTSSIPDGRPLQVQARTRAGNRADVWHRHTLVVGQDRPLTLEVEPDMEPALPGQPLQFELSYGNAGNTAATDTRLEFPVPAHTSVIDFSAGGVLQDDVLVWDTGLLQAGQSSRQWVRVMVDPTLGNGNLIQLDQARFSGQSDFVSRVAWARTQVRVEAAPALDVVLKAGMSPIRSGSVVPVKVSVTNRSGVVLNDLRLEMPYPDTFSSISFPNITDGGICAGTSCSSGNVLVWQLDSLNPGEGRTVAFQGSAGGGTVSGRLPTINVRASAQGQGDAWSRRVALTDSQDRLKVSVVANQDPMPSGETVEYRLGFGNASAVNTASARLKMQLPADATVLLADGGTIQGDRLVWELGDLAAGQVGRRTVRVGFADPLPNGTLLRVPMVTLAGVQEFVNRKAWTNTGLRLGEFPELGLEMNLAPDPSGPGDLVVPWITVTNRSAVLQTGVQVQFLYPGGFSTVSNSNLSDGGSCPGTSCSGGQLATWNLGNLPPGGGRSVIILPSVTPATSPGSRIPMSVRATAEGLRDRWRHDALVVADTHAFALALDLEEGPIRPGSNVMLRLHYGNQSGQAIADSRVRFELPQGLSLMAVDNGVIQDGRWLEWPIGTLSAGKVSRRSALLRVNPAAAPADLIKFVRASIDGDTQLLNPVAWADGSLRVAAQRNLSVDLSVSPQVASPGDPVDVELVVTNHAPVAANGVRVDMPYPQQLAVLSNAAIPGGSCQGTSCSVGNTVTWLLGVMQPGEVRVLSFTPTIRSGATAPALGSLVPFKARVLNEQLDQAVADTSILIGEWVEPPPMIDTLFADRFELAP